MTATSGVAGVGTAEAAPSKKYPVSWDFRSAIPNVLNHTLDANWSPPGANDPSCTLTEERPNPVILLNATATTQWAYSAGAPYLANRGYCVYTFNYGNITPIPSFPIQGLADIEGSAREISRKIDQIMRRTGAKKVDLVGWSQGGGLLPHYYIDFLGGDKKVEKVIGIAPGDHGSTGDMLTYVRFHPAVRPGRLRHLQGALPRLRPAGPVLRSRPEGLRQRRHQAGPALHDDRHQIRRDRDAVHERLPRARQRHEHPSAGRLPGRSVRTSVDQLQ